VAALGGIGGGGVLLLVLVIGAGVYYCRRSQAQAALARQGAAAKFTPQRVSDWGAATRTGGGAAQEVPTMNPYGEQFLPPPPPPSPGFPQSSPFPPEVQVFSDPQGRQYSVNSRTGVTSWLPVVGGAPPPPPFLPGAI
jgi:hypothetical protein